MKKALLVLGLFVMVGCDSYCPPTDTYISEDACRIAWEKKWAMEADGKAMLKDGRIHIGMSQREFAKLWGKPYDGWIDRTTSRYGVTEWWWFYNSHSPTSPGRGRYAFSFENGILDYWSEN